MRIDEQIFFRVQAAREQLAAELKTINRLSDSAFRLPVLYMDAWRELREAAQHIKNALRILDV